MSRAAGFIVSVCLSIAAGTVVAGSSNVQFSAQTVQAAPDKETRQAQIYVGDNQVRLEFDKDGKSIVQIYDMQNRRALLLVPQQASYTERKVPGGRKVNPMLPPSDSNPCAGIPKAKCTQLGSDTLYGRQVAKWEMLVTHEDEQLRSLHWIDVERRMPLREEWPDGTVSILRLLGSEPLNGRATERWESKVTRADGESMQSTQWYDPELQIAIREELPGGYYRELRNIRIAPQPEHLFTVPANYRKVTPEEQQQAAPAGTSRQGAPQQGTPQQSYPQQGMPQRGTSQQGYPQQRTPDPARQYPGR